MGEDGDTKDDVKVPDGEVGDKIEKLFRGDEKDTSESFVEPTYSGSTNIVTRCHCPFIDG